MMSSNSKNSDVEAEAAEWVIRLGDPKSSNSDLAELQIWLAQGPLQQEAYEFASQTWADLSCLSAEGLELEDLHPLAANGGDSAGVQAGVTKAATRGAFRQVALSLCLLTALMFGGLSLCYGNLLIYLQADYIAETGQNQSVTLADGDQPHLSGPV